MNRADNERVEADPEILAAVQNRQPALTEMYELSDVTCKKTDTTVEITGTLTNVSEIDWQFDPLYVFVESDGTVSSDRGVLDMLGPGESAELRSWVLDPDLFADPPECEVQVLDGLSLAYNAELYAKRPSS